MATSAISAIVGGLVGRNLPGARIAWWRGYRQGLEAGTTSKLDSQARVSSLPGPGQAEEVDLEVPSRGTSSTEP
jgi:hypothetical protein